jgi:DNA-binding transcriptional ArsR family regulator
MEPNERPGPGEPPGAVSWLKDPRALRAYAHPVRMALMGLLRTEGPLTATRAAELLGESSGTCSFHLRQLAKYGLVEEAGGGTGREKPWRATAPFTSWQDASEDPEMAAAAGLLGRAQVQYYFEQVTRWLDRSAAEPPHWRDASIFGDRILYVTAGELTDLRRRIMCLVDEYFDRTQDPALRPEDARQVTYVHLTFPAR